MEDFVLRGDICFSENLKTIRTVKDGFLVCIDKKVRGVYKVLPDIYKDLKFYDFKNRLVIPGLADIHIHAPQFSFRGTGMDMELLEWLKKRTFPEESKYKDLSYAEKAYSLFAENMKKSATSRAVIFATRHLEATELLMDKMEATGLKTYVGKVNMDRDAPDDLREESADTSYRETRKWILDVKDRYKNTKPVLTPRFLPSCTDELLCKLGKIRDEFDLPVQSHLSENPDEVKLVKTLFPNISFYAEGYDRYGLFGGENKRCIMAHCVYSEPREVELLKKNKVIVAHCPTSNMNLASGIAPVRKYLDMGIKVGIGTDVAGGHSESVFASAVDAIEVSKLYKRLVDNRSEPITFPEAFYMATAGGGEFFGKVGSFLEGCEFDAVVLHDLKDPCPFELSLQERLERAFYISSDIKGIEAKFVAGERII